MPEESLKKQTVRGVGWSFADSMLGQGITFLVGLVLARLLSPDEYGLIGIIMIFVTVFNAIVDSGFSSALIRKNNATDKDYNTMFLVNLAVSIFLFFAMYFASPLIAQFFQREELTALCRVMGVVVILNALSIVQNTVLTKRLDFKTKTKASFISSLISGVVGVVMAYMGYGVWALVGQQISRQLLNTICLWIFNRWFPNFNFSIESFREMWQFGWKMLASSIIDQTWTQIYQVVIGKCYSPATLGLYTRAHQFADICSRNLTAIVQRVSYPALSMLQDDRVRLKNGYKKVIKVTMLVTFTLMLGLAGCAKSLIIVLIGEQWVECVPMLQVICFSMMFYPLHALNLNMLQVQGRSDLFLKLEIIKKVIAIGPILMGVFIGIYWMLIGSFFTGLMAYYLNAYYSGPFLKYSIKEQIMDFMPSLIMALAMFAILFGMSYLSLNHLALLPVQIIVGAAFTLTVCEIRKPEEYMEIKSIAMPIINNVIKRK
ncbi:MAG: lipopolysaccharide biosynthesis protein [Prevotellaceae bacterium]|nr:lipopolysaccharide biosynthesis protein [Candidatus Minthosoma equi]